MGTTEDLDLLRLEMDTLWGDDVYDRPRPHPLVAIAIAVAGGGQAVRFGPTAPRDMRRTTFPEFPPDAGGDSRPPTLLERYRASLASLEPMRLEGGPSYLFSGEGFPPSSPTLKVRTSIEDVPASLEAARPEPWWEPREWADLLAGRLGPWAVGTVDGRVVALCHTSVASPAAAEAGVWTHPEMRGRGFAPVVTAVWARVAGTRFDTLFYSTSLDNAASQAVARKLALRPLGWIWRLLAEDR